MIHCDPAPSEQVMLLCFFCVRARPILLVSMYGADWQLPSSCTTVNVEIFQLLNCFETTVVILSVTAPKCIQGVADSSTMVKITSAPYRCLWVRIAPLST